MARPSAVRASCRPTSARPGPPAVPASCPSAAWRELRSLTAAGPGTVPQLRAQGQVEPFELAKPASHVPGLGHASGQGHVGLLVGWVLLEEDLRPTGPVQQVGAEDAQPLPGLLGPRLIEVVGQQVAAVGADDGGGRVGIAGLASAARASSANRAASTST